MGDFDIKMKRSFSTAGAAQLFKFRNLCLFSMLQVRRRENMLQYMNASKTLKVVTVYFLESIKKSELALMHCGLGP